MPLSALLTLTALLPVQDAPHVCPTEPPPQSRIDEAVDKGVKFLSASLKAHPRDIDDFSDHTLDTLVLAAMIYGGLPEEHPDVQSLLKRVLDRRPTQTYETVLLEVALDKLDRELYLWKILECGQFLLDTQCSNGQWSYGDPTELDAKVAKLIRDLRTVSEKRRASRLKSKKPPSSTMTLPRIELTAKPFLRDMGDDSNTQFAALGLRICAEAGIHFPADRVALARKFWLENQRKDGGWNYGPNERTQATYLTMTAAGVSSLACLQRVVDLDGPQKGGDAWKASSAKSMEKGIQWLAAHFSFHPEGGVGMREPYSHYSIERAGILSGLEKIGSHPWYAEGAFDLLQSQDPDGGWSFGSGRDPEDKGEEARRARQWELINTGLAILFFRKSIQPMVATGPGGK